MSYIFYGLFLITIDIPINGVDLLPDFLGYILVAIGLNALKHYSRKFLFVMPWVIVMVIYNLFVLLYSFIGWLFPVPVLVTLGFIAVFTDLLVLRGIASGLKNAEEIQKISLGAKSLSFLWAAILIATVLPVATLYFSDNKIVTVLALIIAGLNFIFRIAYLVYVKKSDILLKNIQLTDFN